MRENRQSGLEGGGAAMSALPTPIAGFRMRHYLTGRRVSGFLSARRQSRLTP